MSNDSTPSSPAGTQPTEQPDRQAQPVDLEQPPRLPFPVVGIGASAGGLEAFTDLFKAMPPDSGMSFVLIQHLPPDRESMIAEILQRHTAMVVAEVEDGMEVELNHVYVIRPGHTLTIRDGRLHLGDRVDKPRHSRPVDDFFKSLAEEQRERAICLIMSGMGSNGSAGAQAIKAVGGLCIAQDPETAKFPSMPRNLIDAGYADLILPPAEIPEALIAYAQHPYASADRGSGALSGAAPPPSRLSAEDELRREQQQLREILAIVRTRTRFDFGGYKKPTVLRRIQRRMGLNRVTELGKYAKLLRQSSVEVSGLADDLLIHVTGFFRDPDAWELLRQRVIVPLVQSRAAGGSIRCWVAACSSGEEAYSLAMLLVEESERAEKRFGIKIFATDTAERTLSNARNGIYPGGIESDIAPERLQRFFDRDDAVYRVRPDLRELVVFAPHDVLKDPPYSRLDIVTCRNLLIYLEPQVQQRVFALVHFGLGPGGALFLGSSEAVPAGAGMFEPIDKKARIYRRVGPTRHGAIDFPLPRTTALDASNSARSLAVPTAPSVAQVTTRTLVALHVQAAVTVDRNHRAIYYQGDTQQYLAQPAGEATQDLLALANQQVRGAVRMALQRSMSSNSVQRVPAGWVTNAEGKRCRILVTASPVLSGEAPELFVVSFQELEDPELAQSADPEDGHTAGALPSTDETQRLRDELQSAIEELQASSEEHKAAAEEAMSTNEELQSSNEELETSKEEMQSLNEELTTVNAQLHGKMEELQRTSGDLRSLLASTDIAVIFLDSQFRIRRYTPAVRKLLELIGSDVGRPLSDLAKKFVDPDLLDDAQSVLDHLVPVEREVSSDDGRWYARRVLPYRTLEDRIAGVVVTFVDISDRKRAHDLAAKAGELVSGDLKAMHSLQTATNQLIAAADVPRVLDEILVAALELHATNQGELQLYEPMTQTLRIAAHRGLSAQVLETWGEANLSDGDLPPARALRERHPVLVQDVERELPPTLRDKFLVAGVRAMLCIPLLTRDGELLGVMTLHFHDQHEADERSLRVTQILARLGADTLERMRIEEERTRLLRSEQVARRALDEAAQMKDDFLATLSHELRTPLSAILLWGKVLSNPTLDPERVQKAVGAIIDSAEAQSHLIEDLLDSAAASAGKVRLEPLEMDLAQTVRAVIEQNELAARAKNLRVETELSSDAGVVVADAARLRQVVWNLLTNAVKFTPEGGRIAVSLGRDGDEVMLSVSDTGAGIPPDFLPYVFDRFRQYEASITRKHGGLGLGLAICKQLVEMHGGTIRAESAGTNEGATFIVTLPLPAVRRREPRSGARGEVSVDSPALSGRTILLVEDDSATQDALGLVLREAGASVTTASSGAEAVDLYRESRPQIVLSDIGLPDISGYELLEQIRAFEREHKLPEAPAVALTAYDRDQDRRKAAEVGFGAHLAKPIDADRLLSVLASLARQE